VRPAGRRPEIAGLAAVLQGLGIDRYVDLIIALKALVLVTWIKYQDRSPA